MSSYNGSTKSIGYAYDALGQLTVEHNNTIGKTIYYTYDSGGNIVSKTTYDGVWAPLDQLSSVTDTYTYGDSEWKDLLTAYNGQTITYDAIGNPLTYRRGEIMTWSDGRKLSFIYFNNTGDLIQFYYDSSGIRTRKCGPRVGTHNTQYTGGSMYYIDYYYDGDTLVYERRSQNGTAATELSTIRYIYNGNGNDVSTNYTHIANINPFRYKGYYYDVETGFYYLQSRYYDPETGRFINADGYVSTGQGILGNNMFAYCGNNPVNRADSTGQLWITAGLCILGGMALMGILSSCDEPSKSTSSSSSKKPIKYDVPHYRGHTGVDCGAFCHAMVDSYKNKENIHPSDAWEKALELEGSLLKPKHPTNMDQDSPVFMADDDADKLYSALKKGPLYGEYIFDEVASSSAINSHLVVITGYDPTKGIVYINDPQMYAPIQVSYDKFLTGYGSRSMHFKCAYEPH